MPFKKFKLSEISLDEISLVRSGDDPEARVLIAKSEQDSNRLSGKGTITDKTEEAGMPDEKTWEELPKELTEYIEALEEIAEAALSEEDSEKGSEEDSEKDSEKELVEVGKEAVAELTKEADERIAKAESRAEEAEALAKAERAARLDREYLEKADMLSFIGSTDDVRSLLSKADEFDADFGSHLHEVLTRVNSVIAKSSLMSEYGSSQAGEGDRASAAASEIRKNSPEMTVEQALVAAYEADPDLYEDEIA